MYIRIYMYIYIYVCVCIYILYKEMDEHVYILSPLTLLLWAVAPRVQHPTRPHIYMYIYIYTYIYMYICIHTYMYIYIYKHTDTHTHTHIYVYIYIYIQTDILSPLALLLLAEAQRAPRPKGSPPSSIRDKGGRVYR